MVVTSMALSELAHAAFVVKSKYVIFIFLCVDDFEEKTLLNLNKIL